MRHQERGMTASQLQPENPSPSVPNAGHGIDPGQALSQAQTQFFIPATASLHERRPRTLKHGDSFAVFDNRSEEHTSELQSLMRISYAVFCLKKKKKRQTHSKYNSNRYTN